MNDLLRVPVGHAVATVAAVFSDLGAAVDHATTIAENLVGADRRGIRSHGIARVPMYVDAVRAKQIVPTATPTLDHDAPAASCWDARRSFGQVAMAVLVDHACAGAERVGAHVAVARRSNHFGCAGHWTRRAAERGLLAMVFTSGGPLVIPTGGTRRELGTNPLSLAIRSRRDEFVLDMSTSVVALGKVEVAEREGRPIPTGWAVDGTAEPVTSPGSLLAGLLSDSGGGLLPLGGDATEGGGHKGYGLGMLVEILCAVLSGGTDLKVGRTGEDRFGGNVAQCVIVVDPAHLAGIESTSAALDTLLSGLRVSPPAIAAEPVMIPGDPEREWERRCGDDVLVEPECWDAVTALVDNRGGTTHV